MWMNVLLDLAITAVLMLTAIIQMVHTHAHVKADILAMAKIALVISYPFLIKNNRVMQNKGRVGRNWFNFFNRYR